MGIGKQRELILFAVLFLIFFSPILAYLSIGFDGGNTVLFEDGLIQSFPFRVFLHNAFTGGFSPQWVPYSAFGFSLLAEGQNGICFPSTQIIYRLFSAEIGWMVELLLGRLVAFTLCWIFFRRLEVSRVASFFGACVYAFSGAVFGIESIPAIMWCNALLPGVFLSCDLFLEKRRFSFVYLIIFFSLLFLTGHPVMIIYIGMVIFMYFLFQVVALLRNEKSALQVGVFLLALSAIVLVAVLIAAPQLLPMLQLLPFSARTAGADIPLEVLQNTLHLQASWLPLSLFPTPFYWGDGWNWSNLIRFPFYVLFLGGIGLLLGGGSHRRGFFVFLLVFSVLMALGPYVGLWKIVHSLPILEHFRYPFRWLFFLPICMSFLSARGMDLLLNRPYDYPLGGSGRILRAVIIISSVVGVAIFIRYYATISRLTQKSIENSPYLTGLLWFCVIGMVIAIYVSLTRTYARSGVVWGSALTVASLFATIAFGIQDPMAIRNLDGIGWKRGGTPGEPQSYRTSSAIPPGEIFLSNTLNRHYPYTPNLTVLNETLTTGYYFSFFPYWSANVSSWCKDALDGDHKKRIFLNLSGAKWLFPRAESSFERTSFPVVPYGPTMAYENLQAMPRASVVFSPRYFSDEGSLVAFLESSTFDSRRDVALLTKDAHVWNFESDAKPALIPIEAKILEERPDRMKIALNPVPIDEVFLVLSDTYFPGWRALIDGEEVEVLRVNYAFRGIKLPEGSREIVFFFDPLVPDVVLPLPALILTGLGGAMLLRHRLIRKS